MTSPSYIVSSSDLPITGEERAKEEERRRRGSWATSTMWPRQYFQNNLSTLLCTCSIWCGSLRWAHIICANRNQTETKSSPASQSEKRVVCCTTAVLDPSLLAPPSRINCNCSNSLLRNAGPPCGGMQWRCPGLPPAPTLLATPHSSSFSPIHLFPCHRVSRTTCYAPNQRWSVHFLRVRIQLR